jgi:hypothetical protein
MRGVRQHVRLVVFLIALLLPSLALAERELHWRELAVSAHLDNAGRLHVVEHHAMVFTGDWNGGERRFRLEPGQSLELLSVARISKAGNSVALRSGNLSDIDEYSLIDGRTLRWRSRQPNDPLFDETEVDIAISYVLSNILVADANDLYRLDHDFTFSDRPGIIERFSLELSLDPDWQPLTPVEHPLVRSRLAPGRGVVVQSSLRYLGAGPLAGVRQSASVALRLPWVAVLLLGSVLAFWLLFRREATLGRFTPSGAEDEIDARWLEQNVFCLSPELVGALHDRVIAWPEVAAVIARMTLESKLATRLGPGVRGPAHNLELWLLVEREQLGGYERELVDSLFFSKNTTSTDTIRESYKTVGFNPAAILRGPLGEQSDAMLGLRPVFGWPMWLALAVSVLGLSVSLQSDVAGLVPVVLAVFLGSLGPLWGSVLFAAPWSRDIRQPMSLAWPFLAITGLGVASLGGLLAVWGSLTSIGLASFVCWGITGAALVARVAGSREGLDGFRLRRNLLAARRYFARQLASPEPRIEDAWLPYLIAFELTSEMDHWYHAFGPASARARPHFTPNRTDWNDMSGSSSPPSSGWTGGGGSFGGAGASGSWAAAAAGLTVASPHASTRVSSSTSSSSSSSSGGGGGGGW